MLTGSWYIPGMAKFGRNQRCPCGSGKKYKHCHGNPLTLQKLPATPPIASHAQAMFREMQAREKRREDAQGLGRPIISADCKGYKIVAVGNTIHYSKNWTYFCDFLLDFIKKKLGAVWGAVEKEKPFNEQHPLMQWFNLMGKLHKNLPDNSNGHVNTKTNGIINCFYGLAYNLYLLEHNAALQQRYIMRLRKADQFQGAYYELIVASCMIRAGFTLKLEDEADQDQKHCEFSATSRHTGKKYWVEAKMRSVSGVLGKTDKDGQSPTSKPTSRLSTHIKDALAKPADSERIIFVDVNTQPMTPEDFATDPPRMPKWMDAAVRQLVDRERNLKEGQRAYVFVTNFCFHNALEDTFRGQAVLTFGLGIDDYGKPRACTLSDAWRVKQKHIDMFAIQDALKAYPQVPNSFEGDLPPVAEGERERLKIGQSYNFENAGIRGKVTSAIVMEDERKIYVTVYVQDGKSHMLSEEISDRELEVYRAYKDTYFGVIQYVNKGVKTPYEFFEWMMESYRNTPKDKLLSWMNDCGDFDDLKKLNQLELALTYCERATCASLNEGFSKLPDRDQ